MQIIDSISLWIGRFFVWSVIFLAVGVGIFLSWKSILEPISITFKHLFPHSNLRKVLLTNGQKLLLMRTKTTGEVKQNSI